MASVNTRSSGLSELWSRLRFVLLALIIYRIGTHIPIPGIDPVKELDKKSLEKVESLLKVKTPRLITVSRFDKRKNHEKIIQYVFGWCIRTNEYHGS